jgi:RES domain-containing protein
MIVYRCALKKWSKDLSGQGAFMYGGRWNSPGVYMLYTAENNVLAALEVALRIPLEHISKDYWMVPIDVRGEVKFEEPSLPKSWNLKSDVTRSVGDDFIKKANALAMKVPSALISDAFNYLINPKHPDIRKVKVLEPRPILFDKRLMEMIRVHNRGQ